MINGLIKFINKNKWLIIIAVITLAGLYFRLKFVYGPQEPLSADARNYDAMVRQFLSKGFLGYKSMTPTAYLVPGYPLFLALVYSISGYFQADPLNAVRAVQAFIGAVSIILIYMIGKEIGSKRIGAIAALFAACYLPFIQSTTFILTETLYTFFFLIYLLIQLKALRTQNTVYNILSGIIFAAAVLIRPIVFPLFAFPYIYQFIATRNKKVFRQLCYFTAGMIIIMLPWWVRNFIVLDKFVLLSTSSGNPVFAGSFPYLNYSNLSEVYVPPSQQLKAGLKLIVNGFLTEPLLYLKWFTIGKLSYLYQRPWYIGQRFSSLLYLHNIIIVLGFTGVIFTFIKKKFIIVSLFIILLTVLQLFFIPEARYAYPIIPLLMLLAAYVIDYLFFEKVKEIA